MLGARHRTQADQRRIEQLHELGCIVTLLYFAPKDGPLDPTPGEIHHLLDPETGNRYDDERQHQQTICLRPWYHRGVPPSNRFGRQLTPRQAEISFGPSMARNPKAFAERFGTDHELLECTNRLLEALE